MLFYLRNLCSTEVHRGDPWEIKVKIPDEVRTNKKARDEWVNSPKLKHVCYSLWEGLNPSRRVSTSARDNTNPPTVCHGLALDFDAAATDEKVEKIISRLPLPVYAVERTLTPGYWRAIILFEKPITFSSLEMVKHFLKFIEDLWRPGGNFDKPAFLEANRYYTSSGDFTVRGDVAPVADVDKLQASAFRTYKFLEFHAGINFKIEEIEARLAERHPDFRRLWTGAFDFEAQGPTFWIPESTSPKSAIIKENGIYTFSAHAEKPFYGWSELLGEDFVKDKRDTAYSEITKRIYRTQKEYLIKMHDERWKSHDKSDVMLLLRDQFGLSNKLQPSGLSPVDEALSYIQQFRRVDGAAPFLFCPDELVRVNENLVLNEVAHVRNFISPAEGPAQWGANGKFSWLCQFFDTFFEGEGNPLKYFLAHLSRFYRSAVDSRPASGQAVIIAGGVGIGKTFLTNFILGTMFGGFGRPTDYLLGRDSFGGHLFSSAVWSLDDGVMGVDQHSRRAYAERLKAIVANRGHQYHLKFRTPVDGLQWAGRVYITCNLDPHSLRSHVPDLDVSNRDKVMLFRATEEVKADFRRDESHLEIVRRELPHFCRWLYDHVPDEEVLAVGKNMNRFGVTSYYDADLEARVGSTSSSSVLGDIIQSFADQPGLYKEGTKVLDYIDMLTPDLHQQLTQLFGSTMSSFSATYFTQLMEALSSQPDSRVTRLINGGQTIWRIHRD